MATLKIEAFEYLLSQLCSWQKEVGDVEKMTKVKALKLLFLVASIPVNGNDLLDVFDKFYAMPFGPVEGDVYEAIMENSLVHYEFDDITLKSQPHKMPIELPENLIQKIDASIEQLKQKDNSLITMSAFDLVEYTHTWTCWQDAMYLARIMSKNSCLMKVRDIRRDAKEVWV